MDRPLLVINNIAIIVTAVKTQGGPYDKVYRIGYSLVNLFVLRGE